MPSERENIDVLNEMLEGLSLINDTAMFEDISGSFPNGVTSFRQKFLEALGRDWSGNCLKSDQNITKTYTPFDDDLAALRADWKEIGHDIETAITKI